VLDEAQRFHYARALMSTPAPTFGPALSATSTLDSVAERECRIIQEARHVARIVSGSLKSTDSVRCKLKEALDKHCGELSDASGAYVTMNPPTRGQAAAAAAADAVRARTQNMLSDARPGHKKRRRTPNAGQPRKKGKGNSLLRIAAMQSALILRGALRRQTGAGAAASEVPAWRVCVGACSHRLVIIRWTPTVHVSARLTGLAQTVRHTIPTACHSGVILRFRRLQHRLRSFSPLSESLGRTHADTRRAALMASSVSAKSMERTSGGLIVWSGTHVPCPISAFRLKLYRFGPSSERVGARSCGPMNAQRRRTHLLASASCTSRGPWGYPPMQGPRRVWPTLLSEWSLSWAFQCSMVMRVSTPHRLRWHPQGQDQREEIDLPIT